MRLTTLGHSVVGCATLMAALAPSAQCQDQDPPVSFSFHDPIVVYEPGADPPARSVIVEASNVPDTLFDKTLVLQDVGGQGPSQLTVTFGTPVPLNAVPSANRRSWGIPVSVGGIEPGSRLLRTANIKLGDTAGALLDFTLTNTVAEYSWSVAGPPGELVLGGDSLERRTAMVVSGGDAPVTGLRIVQSTLQEASTKELLGTDYLRLIPDRPSVERRGSERVTLQVDPGFFGPGIFAGSVVFAVDGTPETKSVDLKVYSSSRWLKLWGFMSILLGVVVMFVLAVVAKSLTVRREAFRLRDILKAKLDDPHQKIDEADRKLPHADISGLKHRWDTAEGAIDTDTLKAILPKLYEPPTDQKIEELKEHLQTVANAAVILDELVGRGVVEVLRRRALVSNAPVLSTAPKDPDPDQKFIDALEGLSALSNETDLQKARAGVDAVLAQLGDLLLMRHPVSPLAPPALRAITSEGAALAAMQVLVWVLFFVITAITGYLILIVDNPGFGTLRDLGFCLLWGLGLPAGGEQLQQLTPWTVAGRLNIELPQQK